MKAFFEQGLFDIVIQSTIFFCVFALFLAVFLDFIMYSRKERVQKEKKSVVETGTMTLFFALVYVVLQSGTGRIAVASGLKEVLMAAGTAMVILGCAANIRGRFNLGRNWANQIKIYQEQTLVRTGVYKIVRHPLYASIILMFYGAGLAYRNVVSIIIVSVIFVPFMRYRALQEENLLLQRFPQYEEYRRSTGMLFPKLFKGKERA